MSRGVWVFVLLLTIVGFMVLLAALNLRRPVSVMAGSRVVVFQAPSQIDEGERRYRFGSESRMTLYDVVSALHHAARDKGVSSLVLEIDHVEWGWAMLREVREAVLEFKQSGKPVYASLGWGGDPEYYLASAADVISVPPATVLQVDGLMASVMFYKGTFDKLGIAPHFARVGAYKSAPETYTRSSMSAPMRQALDDLLDDDYAELIDALAAGRAKDPEAIRDLIDEGPFTSETALAAGLIDTVLYQPDVEDMACDAGEGGRSTISLERFAGYGHGPGATRIGMIVAEGTIAPGRSTELPWEDRIAGAETLIDALDRARTQRSIKAIILRINSPGGALPAADEIWRAVRRAAEEKPLIVSMSDVAASGGYYIAAPAAWIVAQPTTVTGSIGVFAGKFNVRGLYEKLGFDIETLSRGKHARMMSPFETFTPEEAAEFQSQVDDGYRLFLMRVTEGRHMDRDAVDAAGQGRVWSGTRALEVGLVDELGGLETAVAAALRELDLPPDADHTIEIFPKVERNFFQNLINDAFDEAYPHLTQWPALPPVAMSWLTATKFPTGTSLALMPYSVDLR